MNEDRPIASDLTADTEPAYCEHAPPTARPISAPLTPPAPPDPMLLLDSSRGRAWLDVVVVAVLIVAATIAIDVFVYAIAAEPGTTAAQLPPEAERAAHREVLIPTLFLRALASVLIIRWFLAWRGQSAASVGLTTRKLGLNLALGLVATFVAALSAILAMLAIYVVAPDVNRQMTENAERIMAIVPPLHPLAFVPVAAAIGFYEELIFRGFLLTRLRRGTGSWFAAVVLATAAFTAPHAPDQTPAALVAVTILGLVFSLFTIWRRSVVPAVVAHTLWNLSMFLYLLDAAGDQWK